MIFLLVETILFQYLKCSFHWEQFSHLLEIYYKRILYYSQWQRIFCLVETIFLFIQIHLETIITIRGRPKFLKSIISARGNRFLQFFSNSDSNGSSFLVQWNQIFQGILHSG